MATIPPEIWGAISVGFAVVSFAPYLWATLRGTNKPHLFTWIIWTLLTAIAFALQYLEGAGSGSWSGAVSTLFSVAILVAAIRHGEKHITRSDWVVFLLALMAIPIWLITQNAAWAAVWVTAIDGAGYIPTMRKSWIKPYEEMTTTHALSMIKHVCVLLAVQNVHFATVFYSWGMIVMNGLLVLMIWVRRAMLYRAS